MILVTGATGYLGGEVAAQLIEAGIPALFLSRGQDPVARLQDNINKYRPYPIVVEKEKVIIGGLDNVESWIRDPRLRDVTTVINCAAVASYSTNPIVVKTNRDDTGNFAVQARWNLPLFQKFVQVGTAFSCGIRDQDSHIAEEIHPLGQQFNNYSQSKNQVQSMLASSLKDKFTCCSPSIIVGHSQYGCKISPQIFWIFRIVEQLEAFTFDLDQTIDVVPVDWVAAQLIAIAQKDTRKHRHIQLTAGNTACTFREIYSVFDQLHGTGLVDKYTKLHVDDVQKNVGKLGLTRIQNRAMKAAIKHYGMFAACGYKFDNNSLDQLALPQPPKYTDYLGTCIEDTDKQDLWSMMQFDFRV